MGLFGGILKSVLGGGKVTGNTGGGGGGIDFVAIMGWVQQQGGLQVLLEKLQQGQLGDVVGSWLGKGSNQAIGGADIQQALGSDSIDQLAGKLGVDPQKASEILAQLLPNVVDKASPEGQLQQPDDLAGFASKMFK
jgi:uncharacterized protein YidB (DUF937 family)